MSCPSGYYASNHQCKLRSVYEVDIKEYDKALYVLQGETINTSLSVKNTGNQNLTVMLAVELDAAGVNVSVTPASQEIHVDATKNFSISFDVLKNTSIGNYSGKFKVTTSSTAKDTVSFTLVVQPLAETIEEIKASYENYTQIVEQLIADFNNIKLSGLLSAQNLTMLEAKVNATKLLFDNAKAAMETGNYIQLSTLLDEIKTLVNQTRTLMEELGVAQQAGAADFWSAVIMWLIVGMVCIGAVGLLIYMLVPPQGYALGKGYPPPGKATIVNRMKGILNSLKTRIAGGGGQPTAREIAKRAAPAYKAGYQKIGLGYTPETGGIVGKLKKIFKRK